MPRLSKLLEKLEDTVEARWGVWFQRHKKKLPLYIPVGLVCWYFYGMLLNSMRLGQRCQSPAFQQVAPALEIPAFKHFLF